MIATVRFKSLESAEVVEVEFLRLQGDRRTLRLLVDTGFSGRSSIVLGVAAVDLVWAALPPTQTTGALLGIQQRAWVTCQVPGLALQSTLIAIVTDLTVLSLPENIDGMVGLSFLRQFVRWGAERTSDGSAFFLCDSID